MNIAANGLITLTLDGVDPSQFAVFALVEPGSTVATVESLQAKPAQVVAGIGEKMLQALEQGGVDNGLTAIDFICRTPAELNARAAYFGEAALRLHSRTNGRVKPHGDNLGLQQTLEYLAADNNRSVHAWLDLS